MKKEIAGYVRLQIKGGQANPAPPVGPALGQHGVNIMEFCKDFNDKSKDQMGMIIPVEIKVCRPSSAIIFNRSKYTIMAEATLLYLQLNCLKNS